jgi:cytochrome c556
VGVKTIAPGVRGAARLKQHSAMNERIKPVSHVVAAGLLALLATLGACGNTVEDTRPGQPVKTRQTAFKEMLRVFEPMGTMLRDGRYDATKFSALAEDLKQKREAPWSHFGAGTFYPPTKAKADVWAQPELFERDRQAFFDATDALFVAALTRQLETVEKAYFAAYDTCQGCHKRFKEK